jgi:hypothetical protein
MGDCDRITAKLVPLVWLAIPVEQQRMSRAEQPTAHYSVHRHLAAFLTGE